MLRLAVTLSLALVALAAVTPDSENVRVVDGVRPSITVRDGGADVKTVNEDDEVKFMVQFADGEIFQCHRASDVAPGDSSNTALKCERQFPGSRRTAKNGGGVFISVGDPTIPSHIYDLYLSLSQSLWQNLYNTQASILSLFPPIVRPPVPFARSLRPDGVGTTVKTVDPFGSLLVYEDVPSSKMVRKSGGIGIFTGGFFD